MGEILRSNFSYFQLRRQIIGEVNRLAVEKKYKFDFLLALSEEVIIQLIQSTSIKNVCQSQCVISRTEPEDMVFL